MTETRKNTAKQKALPLSDWPCADREAWQAAQAGGGILDEGGAASHLREISRQDLTRRYAYFLSFAAQQGALDADGPAAAAVTQDNILAYLRYLESRVSSVTLAQSVQKVGWVASFLAPEQDWVWLLRIARRLDLRAKPRDRRKDVVEIKDLYRLGMRLMKQAETSASSGSLARAVLYRDGLLIALMSADPLRLANMVALEIGRTLIKAGTSWSFEIPAEETKERRLHLAVLPDWSAICIDRYIETYRPLFRNSDATARVWLSQLGLPLSMTSVYSLVCTRTSEAFGRPINPHLIRSCLATSVAIHHGAQIGLAMTVLRHQNPRETERHYIRAEMIDAVRTYQELLLGDQE